MFTELFDIWCSTKPKDLYTMSVIQYIREKVRRRTKMEEIRKVRWDGDGAVVYNCFIPDYTWHPKLEVWLKEKVEISCAACLRRGKCPVIGK